MRSNIKKNVIKELKYYNYILNKSPGRRDIPSKFYRQCRSHFGSFNNAKLKAGLKIFRRKCNPLPKKCLSLDKRLVRIMSYLTFDGHLYKDLSAFQFISNNNRYLKILRNDIKKKFLIDVYKITYGEENIGGYGKHVYKYWYNNTNLSKFLYNIGTPKGDKTVTRFDVPKWIKENKKFAREYLRIAFLCEGSKFKRKKNEKTDIIRININKSQNILEDGVNFMNSMKKLLEMFDIKTTNLWLCKGNLRKDGNITKSLVFQIKANSTNKFIKEIGWLK